MGLEIHQKKADFLVYNKPILPDGLYHDCRGLIYEMFN